MMRLAEDAVMFTICSVRKRFLLSRRDAKADDRFLLCPFRWWVFFVRVMNFPETTLDWAQVTAETLSHTYNGKDLDPTEVDKELSDLVDKSSSEDNVELNTGGHAAIAWGLIDAGGNLSGKDFQKRAAEHGVKVVWDGKKWVAKGLDIHQVDTTQLSQKINRSCSFETYAEGTDRSEQTRPLQF
jgi:hypothetical protein